MKMNLLNEVNKISNVDLLVEGMVSPEILMILQNVVKDGKITDLVQTVFMAKLMDVILDSRKNTIPDLFPVMTSTDKMNFIKMLEPEDQVNMANYYINVLNDRNYNYKYNCNSDCEQQDTGEWLIQFIRNKKRND